MSSWASIELDGHRILETQNHFYMWFFRRSERQIAHDPETGLTTYKFTVSGEKLRRRLELAGHNLESLKQEFARQLDVMKEDCRAMVEIDPGGQAAVLLPLLEASSFEDWQDRLRRITGDKLARSLWGEPTKEHGDPLLTYMLSSEPYFFSDNAGGGGYGFPCTSYEGWAVALLEVLPVEVECILDVSDLVDGGWTDEFEDLAEFMGESTVFYSIFKAFLAEVLDLTKLIPAPLALPRMLYAAVITAMETYLADTLRKQVLVKPAAKRRFVETHQFGGRRTPFELANIYKEFEALDVRIADEVDRLSFHHLPTVEKLFKSVLLTEFSRDHLNMLGAAVQIRHDIVHRNGKTVKGVLHPITMAEVVQLAADVDAAMLHIDGQIKDGLLDDVDEENPTA